MSDRVPIIVVTGFLGAGKTTFVNRVLGAADGPRSAVLVNDFGAVNIDQRLVLSQQSEVLSLANGCVCCGLQADLVNQIAELIRDGQSSFDQIVIESSGVSDPAGVLRALGYPQIRKVVRVAAVIGMLDVSQFDALSGASRELAESQALGADVVVLTKVDIAPQKSLSAVLEWCRQFGIRCVDSTAAIDALEVLANVDNNLMRPIGPTRESIWAEETFESWAFRDSRPMRLTGLRETLQSLPPEVFRAKGLVRFDEIAGVLCSVQVVGDRVEITRIEGRPDDGSETVLVFIGLRGRVDWSHVSQQLRGNLSFQSMV